MSKSIAAPRRRRMERALERRERDVAAWTRVAQSLTLTRVDPAEREMVADKIELAQHDVDALVARLGGNGR